MRNHIQQIVNSNGPGFQAITECVADSAFEVFKKNPDSSYPYGLLYPTAYNFSIAEDGELELNPAGDGLLRVEWDKSGPFALRSVRHILNEEVKEEAVYAVLGSTCTVPFSVLLALLRQVKDLQAETKKPKIEYEVLADDYARGWKHATARIEQILEARYGTKEAKKIITFEAVEDIVSSVAEEAAKTMREGGNNEC